MFNTPENWSGSGKRIATEFVMGPELPRTFPPESSGWGKEVPFPSQSRSLPPSSKNQILPFRLGRKNSCGFSGVKGPPTPPLFTPPAAHGGVRRLGLLSIAPSNCLIDGTNRLSVSLLSCNPLTDHPQYPFSLSSLNEWSWTRTATPASSVLPQFANIFCPPRRRYIFGRTRSWTHTGRSPVHPSHTPRR